VIRSELPSSAITSLFGNVAPPLGESSSWGGEERGKEAAPARRSGAERAPVLHHVGKRRLPDLPLRRKLHLTRAVSKPQVRTPLSRERNIGEQNRKVAPLGMAAEQGCVLITNDKDFGDLVFRLPPAARLVSYARRVYDRRGGGTLSVFTTLAEMMPGSSPTPRRRAISTVLAAW
jgi:hypothetical protein